MDWLTELFLALVSATDHPLGLAALAASAGFEYVFPPFPGDTITLFGAVLITGYGWSFSLVFGAVMVGSVAGAMIAFQFGLIWRRRRVARKPDKVAAERTIVEDLVTSFERYGAAYLVINRFLPGIRALFFVAAGLAGMRTRAVLFYSTLSAALWNLGVIALGSLLGANLDRLQHYVATYTALVWIAVAAIAVLVGVRIYRKRKRRRAGQTETH